MGSSKIKLVMLNSYGGNGGSEIDRLQHMKDEFNQGGSCRSIMYFCVSQLLDQPLLVAF